MLALSIPLSSFVFQWRFLGIMHLDHSQTKTQRRPISCNGRSIHQPPCLLLLQLRRPTSQFVLSWKRGHFRTQQTWRVDPNRKFHPLMVLLSTLVTSLALWLLVYLLISYLASVIFSVF